MLVLVNTEWKKEEEEEGKHLKSLCAQLMVLTWLLYRAGGGGKKNVCVVCSVCACVRASSGQDSKLPEFHMT